MRPADANSRRLDVPWHSSPGCRMTSLMNGNRSGHDRSCRGSRLSVSTHGSYRQGCVPAWPGRRVLRSPERSLPVTAGSIRTVYAVGRFLQVAARPLIGLFGSFDI